MSQVGRQKGVAIWKKIFSMKNLVLLIIVPDQLLVCGLKDLKDSKLILNITSLSYSHDHLGSFWYHSEPSEGLYSPNQ